MLVKRDDVLPESVLKDAPYLHSRENYALGRLWPVKFVGIELFSALASKVGLLERAEERYIHLSEEFVEKLRKDCQEELDRAGMEGKLEEGAGLKLTKNYIIRAWFMQRAYAHIASDSGPVDLLYIFNYRPALPPPSPGIIHLHNNAYGICAHFPPLASRSPSASAAFSISSLPQCVLEFWEANASALLTPVTPWTTFEYNRLDSLASLKDRQTGSGRVVYPSIFRGIDGHDF